MSYYKEYDDYIISVCEKRDIDDVCRFFDSYWLEGHYFILDREYLDFQFFNERHDNYNFIIARDKASNEIIGELGFIPNYIFDYNIPDDDKFIWLSNWRVRSDYMERGALGVKLLSSVFLCENTKNIGALGVYESAEPLYRMMKFETGSLEHYFCLNSSARNFSIADLPTGYIERKFSFKPSGAKSHLEIVDWNNFASFYDNLDNANTTNFPKKSSAYYLNRYQAHPRYKYDIMSIKTNDTSVCAFIFRTVVHENAAVLRIVDGFGDFSLIGNIYDDFQSLLNERNAEYIDLYCHGIDSKTLENAGFTKRKIDDKIVIPNFFEPFERINKNVNYAFYNEGKRDYIIFRGDGDQDRPNMLQ